MVGVIGWVGEIKTKAHSVHLELNEIFLFVCLPNICLASNYSDWNKKLRNVIQVPQNLTHIFNSCIIAISFTLMPTFPLVHTHGHCFVHGQAEQICHLSLALYNSWPEFLGNLRLTLVYSSLRLIWVSWWSFILHEPLTKHAFCDSSHYLSDCAFSFTFSLEQWDDW